MGRSRLLIALAAAAALGGSIVWWSRRGDGGDRGYVTVAVERGDITATVTATGTVNPVTTVQVGTYVSGPIIAIDVDFNSPVAKGQRVARIDPAPFQVKVQRADANLSNKNLLLSENAEIDTQPVLEIHADEVKAAHGATVGRLDANALFYLRSRGLPQAQARKLLTAAFCREPLAMIEGADLRATLTARVDAALAALETA